MAKRKEGIPASPEERAKAARRRSRIRLGNPPPPKVIIPKNLRDPKHKKKVVDEMNP